MGSKNKIWGIKLKDDRPINVVLFISRNKDNKGIDNYKERRYSFITNEDRDSPKLLNKFYAFVNDGLPGELSRMYYSQNRRKPEVIYKELLHFLIDNPDFNLPSIDSKIAGIAAKKECSAEKRWFFDFDVKDNELLQEFLNDINKIDDTVYMHVNETIHGYAVEVNHGFDTRSLLEKWSDYEITLKRDDLLLINWKRKEN